MPKITKQFIENEIKYPKLGQLIYRDDEIKGFGIRVTPNCVAFIAERRFDNRTCRVTLGRFGEMTVEAARKTARNALAEMGRGHDPRTGKKINSAESITLRQVMEKYLAVKQLRPATVRSYEFGVGKCLTDWLDMPVISITKDMVEIRHHELTVAKTRLGTGGRARANGSLKMLSTLIDFASDRYGTDDEPLIKVNPVIRIRRNRAWHKIQPRTGIIPDHKLNEWYKAVATLKNDVARDYLLFLLLTGMRPNESRLLKWQYVNFETNIITVPREITKSDREHKVPMSDFIIVLLSRRYHKRVNSDWVFQSAKDGRKHIAEFIYLVNEIRDKCGVKFQLHDLRRTFLTMAEKLDVPHYALKKLVNHSLSRDITSRYIILDLERLRKHMQRITDEFVELLGVNPQDPGRQKRVEAGKSATGRQLLLSISVDEDDEPD